MARLSRSKLIAKGVVRAPGYGRPKGSLTVAEQQAIRTARGW